MELYQIDTFTDQVFSGNPAAVCPLKEWLDDEIMQKIAAENNLAETAFYVKNKNEYQIRWFTPKSEVDLCGHATLATAFVIYNFENYKEDVIRFFSERSGVLTVSKEDDFFTLNFPVDVFEQTEVTVELLNCFPVKPKTAYKGKTDYMLVFDEESDIKTLVPNLTQISKLNARGVIVTSKGTDSDFVTRFFAPACGVDEDAMCGSAHTTLIPYWAKEFDKTELSAIQLSERRGFINCKYLEDRVEIGGKAKLYLKGEIFF